MDILATIVASALMLVGFLVICRTTAEDEDAYYEIEEEYDEENETVSNTTTENKTDSTPHT